MPLGLRARWSSSSGLICARCLPTCPVQNSSSYREGRRCTGVSQRGLGGERHSRTSRARSKIAGASPSPRIPEADWKQKVTEPADPPETEERAKRIYVYFLIGLTFCILILF